MCKWLLKIHVGVDVNQEAGVLISELILWKRKHRLMNMHAQDSFGMYKKKTKQSRNNLSIYPSRSKNWDVYNVEFYAAIRKEAAGSDGRDMTNCTKSSHRCR